MNIVRASILAVTLLAGASTYAVTIPATPHAAKEKPVLRGEFKIMGFKDRPEADMLRRAYHILATGDHDYKGHRAAAMHAVEKAGKLLGLDLKGDDKDHEKQALSDDRLKEARDLLQKVLGAAEVKAQEKIAKHISAAIKDINVALKIR